MNKYFRGHVEPWWNDDFKTLDYIYTPLNNPSHYDKWISQGYNGVTLNGGSYDQPRPMPDYAEPFFQLFNWESTTISFFRMLTLEILPKHSDQYLRYREVFNIVEPASIWRAIVFLEDWRSGHWFEVGDEPIVPWQRGDYVVWNFDTEHAAGNFGTSPRYTCQITGVKKQ